MPEVQKAADPALAINTDEINDLIGRLYRKPDFILPENLDLNIIKQLVQDGLLFPSTTNIISVKSSPHLIPWSNYVVAKELVEFILNDSNSVERIEKSKQIAINWFKNTPIRDRDNAGKRGSNIHLAVEQITKGKTIKNMSLTEDEKKAVDNWKRWVDTFQPEFHHLEVTGFGTTKDDKAFGGTIDFTAKINSREAIGDYKCVVDDTKILMADGSQKNAIDIKEGDMVVAWSKSNNLHTGRVSYAGDNGFHKTITITTTSGQTLTTTLNHPYWSSQRGKNLGWVKAEDLRVGDELYSAIGWNYAPAREVVEWPFGRNLSPYALGLLWAIRNYGTEDWRTEHLINLPKISRSGLREELHELGFHFNKAGQLNTRKGLAKIARKNGLEISEVLDLFDREDLPSFVFASDGKYVPGFLTAIREVFVNKEVYDKEIYVVFRHAAALKTLQQYLLNHGQPANIHKDIKSGLEYLRTPFEDEDTIYGYGPSATRISSIQISEEVEHTVALEVEGSHTHVTNGLITHNTNRSGLHSDIALQLAANARFKQITPDNKTLIPMPKIELGLGVHISANKVTTKEVDISESVWGYFESLRNAWDFHAFEGRLNKPEGVFLREINSPKDL